MEFTLFLNAAVFVLILFFLLIHETVRLAAKNGVWLGLFSALSLVLAAFVPLIGASLFLVFLLCFLALRVEYFKHDRAVKYGLFFLVIGALLFAFYYPYGKSIFFWELVVEKLYAYDLMKGALVDLFTVVRFFGYHYPVYPAVLAGILHLAFRYGLRDKCYHRSFWYRFMRVFDHRQIFLTAGGFILLGAVYYFCGNVLRDRLAPEQCILIKDIALNLAVYFALPYLFFGFVSLIYGLRRQTIPLFLSLLLIYGFVVFSGPVFIFTLILIMGLGMTDIWMNYHKRTIRFFKAKN